MIESCLSGSFLIPIQSAPHEPSQRQNITSIEELLSATGDRVNIMEEQIDVITQQNYTLLANFIQAHPDYERIRREFRENMDELFGDTLEKEQKKRMLVALADFAEPEVYRAIERFAAMNTPLKSGRPSPSSNRASNCRPNCSTTPASSSPRDWAGKAPSCASSPYSSTRRRKWKTSSSPC